MGKRLWIRNMKNKRIIIAVSSVFLLLVIGIAVGYKIGQYKNPSVNARGNPDSGVKTSEEEFNNREEQVNQGIAHNVEEQMEVMNVYKPDGKKTAYLTFDDGPSKVTPEVLDILKKNNVHATFFVIGNLAEKRSDLILREAQEGHRIDNHTYSHVYKNIYASPDSFIEDVNKCNEILKKILGTNYKSRIIRFPGGSFGSKMAPYRDAISKAGYSYIDWNSLNGDAESKSLTPDKLVTRLKQTAKGEHLVVLMHDAAGKVTTPKALQQIIDYLKASGYSFKTL